MGKINIDWFEKRVVLKRKHENNIHQFLHLIQLKPQGCRGSKCCTFGRIKRTHGFLADGNGNGWVVRIRFVKKTSGFCWPWPIKGRMEKPPIFFFSFNRRFLPSKTWERFDWRNSTNWLTQGVHLIRCFWGQGGGSIYSKCFWNLGDHWHGWDRSSTRMVRYKSYLFRRDDLPNTFPFPYRNGFSLVFFLGGGTLWGHQLVSKHKQPW